jgi:hypothetical protein
MFLGVVSLGMMILHVTINVWNNTVAEWWDWYHGEWRARKVAKHLKRAYPDLVRHKGPVEDQLNSVIIVKRKPLVRWYKLDSKHAWLRVGWCSCSVYPISPTTGKRLLVLHQQTDYDSMRRYDAKESIQHNMDILLSFVANALAEVQQCHSVDKSKVV